MEKRKLNIQITEIFMAKCGRGNKGFDRCFYGTIRRERDENGNPVVYGKIKIGSGYIYAKALDQWILGEMLDEMVLLILNGNLHAIIGKTTIICGEPYHLT